MPKVVFSEYMFFVPKVFTDDVEIEPSLIPISGEVLHHSANQQQEARLDISIRGFWQRGQRAFTDIRIFNPFAPTHLNQKLENCFSNNEREKKRSYGQWVHVFL